MSHSPGFDILIGTKRLEHMLPCKAEEAKAYMKGENGETI